MSLSNKRSRFWPRTGRRSSAGSDDNLAASFLAPGNELMQDGWTFRGCTQFVEYLRIGSEE
jgi:hypothetical protein